MREARRFVALELGMQGGRSLWWLALLLQLKGALMLTGPQTLCCQP